MRVDERETICQLPAGNHKVGKPVTRFLPPSPTALRSWIRLYERCARSPLAFLRKRRSDLSYARKLVGETEILLAECVSEYLSRNKPSQQMVVDRTRTRFIETNENVHCLGCLLCPYLRHVPFVVGLLNSTPSKLRCAGKALSSLNASLPSMRGSLDKLSTRTYRDG